jgi:hypothetical protein
LTVPNGVLGAISFIFFFLFIYYYLVLMSAGILQRDYQLTFQIIRFLYFLSVLIGGAAFIFGVTGFMVSTDAWKG